MKPINSHLKIKPMEHEEFMASTKGTYDEIGVVVDMADDLTGREITLGSRVYFDSWLAKKYPVRGKVNEYEWFVKYEDIVAIDNEPLSE